MTIYISKEISIHDYEVDIELNEEEVLDEMDVGTIIDYVVERATSRILDKMDNGDIVAHIANDKPALAALLRAVADQLKYQ